MLKSTALLLLLLMLVTPAAAASPVKARTLSGIGVLLISREQPQITLFKEASLGRIVTTDVSRLPLSLSIHPPEGFLAAIVTAKKGGWFRIFYDDGEREGWIEGRSSYQFYRWAELLRNRPVALIGGLRKEFYLLRRTPDSASGSIDTLGKESRVTSLEVEGDWIRVLTDSQAEGWLRWCDENGRLVIAVNL